MLFMKWRTENCSAIVRPIFCAAVGILIQTTGTTGGLFTSEDIYTIASFRRLLSPNHKKKIVKIMFRREDRPLPFSESKHSVEIDLVGPDRQS